MNNDTPSKRCSKCGLEKNVSLFSRRNNVGDGFYAWCKECAAIYRKEYRRLNLEKITEKQAIWRNNNREYLAEWRRANVLRLREEQKKRRDKDRKKENIRRAEWRKKNPENARCITRRRRARLRNSEGTHTAQETKDMFRRQKGKCYYCGFKLINPFTDSKHGAGRKAHLDHVIPLKRGGRNDIGNLVWACSDCNASKADKLPHEWKGNGGRLI